MILICLLRWRGGRHSLSQECRQYRQLEQFGSTRKPGGSRFRTFHLVTPFLLIRSGGSNAVLAFYRIYRRTYYVAPASSTSDAAATAPVSD